MRPALVRHTEFLPKHYGVLTSERNSEDNLPVLPQFLLPLYTLHTSGCLSFILGAHTFQFWEASAKPPILLSLLLLAATAHPGCPLTPEHVLLFVSILSQPMSPDPQVGQETPGQDMSLGIHDDSTERISGVGGVASHLTWRKAKCWLQ